MEWRAIAGWPYEVSSEGDVRRRGAATLKPQANVKRGGYRYVVLRDRGRRRDARVAVLVCEAFHGPRPDGCEAAHSNHNRSDDRAANLGWKTKAENTKDKVVNDSWGKKLTNETAAKIKADTRASAEVAEEYGVSVVMVCRIRRGASWVHV